MSPPEREERDLVLAPNTYALVLKRTTGKVALAVGPHRQPLSENDQLVVWDGYSYIPVFSLAEATKPFMRATEGQYIELTDPALEGDERFPRTNGELDPIALDTGRRINIPGPISFALWPGQTARVIDGHHLRHNQYLVTRVYDPDAARTHREKAVVAPAPAGASEGSERTSEDTEPPPQTSTDLVQTEAEGPTYRMGQLDIKKGTDVSFYIPPSGIEVVPESEQIEEGPTVSNRLRRPGSFVRNAATLERMQYCVLVDEDGTKRFERGPKVVFPDPTETFVTDNEGNRTFEAIELNAQSGLYIKVIAGYREDDGTDHHAGEELFITGAESPIVFPREEWMIIQYGDRMKIHAVAITKGAGRYVLKRLTGDVDLIRGPRMFLPDPRIEVIVRRVLDPATVRAWYPDNAEALEVNRLLAAERDARMMHARAAGDLTEDYEFGEQAERASTGIAAAAASQYLAAEPEVASERKALRSQQAMLHTSHSHGVTPTTAAFGGQKIRRGTEYTPPRSITLDTKYEGPPGISPWPGFCVLVMDKSGNRKVVEHPESALLEYDETLMILSLSTGTPKTDRARLRTPYLQLLNNQVSDQVQVETKDLVPVMLPYSLRVNFEGDDPLKWFNVEDYVGLLVAHVRSKLRNLAKRHDIQEFYTNTIDLVRDSLLGLPAEGERPGMAFDENGMRVYEIEVGAPRIMEARVEDLLGRATRESLEGAITLSQRERATEREQQLQELARRQLDYKETTSQKSADIRQAELQRALDVEKLQELINEISRASNKADADTHLQIRRDMDAADLERLREEVRLAVSKVEAFSPSLITAIAQYGDQHLVETLIDRLGPVALATGANLSDILANMLKGTELEGITGTLASRPWAQAHNGGTTMAGREVTPQ